MSALHPYTLTINCDFLLVAWMPNVSTVLFCAASYRLSRHSRSCFDRRGDVVGSRHLQKLAASVLSPMPGGMLDETFKDLLRLLALKHKLLRCFDVQSQSLPPNFL